MKLDKIRFARLIAFVQQIMPKRDALSEEDISDIDYIIDVSVPQPANVYPEVSDVNELMRIMAAGTNKIDAIRIHRKLTGYGLKDSKEEIERHWKSADYTPVKPAVSLYDSANGVSKNQTFAD